MFRADVFKATRGSTATLCRRVQRFDAVKFVNSNFKKVIMQHSHDKSHFHDYDEHDDHNHSHRHGNHGGHGHTHGMVDPSLITSKRGIWAIKWSFVLLFVTALFQSVIAWLSGSVSLLADTIHNVGDAATAVPLWIAFTLSRRNPNQRFTYGYGRVEDLAGVAIILTITFSAIVAAYETIQMFLHPQPIRYLWAVVIASILGFVGNEAVAVFRIRVGKQIESAALIADGYHARVDGLTSLAVLFGALGVGLGYPLADPIMGVFITIAIVQIVWQSSKAIFTRMLDGVEPHIIDEIREAVSHAGGIEKVTEVRARWLGHRLHTELNIAVGSHLSVAEGHVIAKEVRHELLHHLTYLSSVVIHVDPTEEAGEMFHHIVEHTHDGLPLHSH
jgi:cation diffusion facilitator family transporter